MQRVVRSTLVGLLTIAGLTACGDKVTLTPPTPATVDNVVHGVTVSPGSITLTLPGTGTSGKATLAASVDAGAGVTNRTVTWTSSNAAVATVGSTDGIVTAVAAGTATITAASVADPTVKGAASVTVLAAPGGGGGTGTPSVTIVSVNQTNAFGQSVPANVLGAAGQLDVIVNVEPNGATIRTVSVSISAGGKTMTQTQTLSGNVASEPFAAEAASSLLTFSFNTAAFFTATTGTNPCNPAVAIPANTVIGTPCIGNGPATITATVTTTASGQTPAATSNVTYTLANADGVLLTTTFAAITNAEGITQPTSANDAFGLPWRSGSVTLSAVPVLYSGRTISSVTLTLPGATNPSQTLTTAPFTQTWSGSATTGARVTGLVLVDMTGVPRTAGAPTKGACNPGAANPVVPPACGAMEINGNTPQGVTPTVIALDAAGNDLGLVALNAGIINNSTFRLDDQPPQAPLTFNIPNRQFQWVNGSYVFVGTGGGTGGANVDNTGVGTANYISCGDGRNLAGNATAAGLLSTFSDDPRTLAGPYVCQPEIGVSASTNGNRILASGSAATNGNTTLSYYSMPAASYTTLITPSATNGTGTTATACSLTGWTKITTAGDLAGTLLSSAYIVRVFESDKLLNARCTDLALPTALGGLGTLINSGVTNQYFNNGKAFFGVDKIPPTAVYVENVGAVTCGTQPVPADANAAGPNGVFNLAGHNGNGGNVPNNFNVKIAICDDPSQPSGTSTTPVTTMVQRFYIDPTTSAPSNFISTANGCPSGLSNAGTCTTRSAPSTVAGWFGTGTPLNINTPPGTNGGADASGCVGCGYFVFTQTPLDNARNAATSLGVSSAPTSTVTGAVCGGAGCRQVLIDVMAPVMGGISTPATITGGTTAVFGSNATDNLDLGNYDYTLTYPAQPVNDPVANLPIRSPSTTPGQTIGASFDNVLTTTSPVSLSVPNFIRSLVVTTAGDAPTGAGTAVRPASITGRVYDAAGNPSAPVQAVLSPANIPLTNQTDFTVLQTGGGTMQTFKVINAATNISNAGAGAGAAVNPTVVTLTAQATGTETAAAQFINPFATVQFYYFDTTPSVQEWILIGSAPASSVTDNAGVTLRTFTWAFAWDPPAVLGAGGGITAKVIAIGITSAGDALASQVNSQITLTSP